jgi:hypothetical protein
MTDKKKVKLKDVTDGIEKGRDMIKIADAMTGDIIPFADEAEKIADVAIESIGLFARLRNMFKKKKKSGA